MLGGCAYVKHVPPGQSLSEAMAPKAQVVALPAPPPPPLAAANAAAESEAPLPQTERVADAFTLGNLCLQQGRYTDAIAAYETAVKADPTFAEAWNNLAIAYQNAGEDEKAMAAFRKYKTVAR
jgi:Flp pilus assembly protein TadD